MCERGKWRDPEAKHINTLTYKHTLQPALYTDDGNPFPRQRWITRRRPEMNAVHKRLLLLCFPGNCVHENNSKYTHTHTDVSPS